ncbi:MAG: HDOD domain-containing protein [Candidatus Didemnitutus sp.]|nr:HDOD domain-containing protein [Candidatus Didemnitutus sp.]
MKDSFQAVLHRWWALLWSDGGALPAAAVEEPPVVILELAPVVSEPTQSVDPHAARREAADAARVALAEIVMRPVEETALVMAVGDAEIALRREQTMDSLAELKQIPALQSLARGFLQAASREDVDLDEVVAAIGKDPALCVRISRMANSAALRPEQSIEDLKHAVQLLGMMRVRTLARALYTLRDSRSIAPGFDWRHLWIHALATATLAEQIERRLSLGNDPVLYLAALLHDVGKIVLSVACPDEYAVVMIAAWNQTRPLDDLERSQLGLSHREAGEIYLERSGLPAVVVSTALHHHRPNEAPEEHRQQVAIVALANYLSKAYGLGFSGSALAADDENEFVELDAWTVLEATTGRVFDRMAFEEEIQLAIPEIKNDLRVLREVGN